MSQQARQNLAPSTSEGEKTDLAKRKMTAAIIEDSEQKKETYEFLEEDDDFEEFEQEEGADGNYDVDMVHQESDKKLWYDHWLYLLLFFFVVAWMLDLMLRE